MRVKDVWVPLAALLAYVFIRVLSWTWRVQLCPKIPWKKRGRLKTEGTSWPVGTKTTWRPCFVLDVKGATLASRRNAGQTLALTIKRFGWDAIRGRGSAGQRSPRSHDSVPSERQRPVAITVDGASGPRRQTKPGILAIATRTNVPIVPAVGLASRCWVIKNSWTSFAFPNPSPPCPVLTGRPCTRRPICKGCFRRLPRGDQ